MSEYIKKNEPDTLKYEIHREVNKKSGAEQVIMIETCKSVSFPAGPNHVFQLLFRQKQSRNGSPWVIKGVQGFSKEDSRGGSSWSSYATKICEECWWIYIEALRSRDNLGCVVPLSA